jgi:sugar phosphate isomerase/epimerase
MTTGTLATSAVTLEAASAPHRRMKAGIQLWTLRDTVETDTRGTLESLAAIGYDSLEPYGFDGSLYGQPAKEFRKICNDLGMVITSTHSGISIKNAVAFAEKGAEAGLEFLVLPSFSGRPDKTLDDYRKAAHEMNLIGEITRKSGIAFGYHNHSHEFQPIDGMIPYDILLAETDPSLVTFQVDLFWMTKAGFNPGDYFAKHPGRFATWHIKDMGMDGASCIIGNGKINFRELMKQAGEAGLRRMFVEQEEYAEGAPIYCAAQSYRYIRRHLL